MDWGGHKKSYNSLYHNSNHKPFPIIKNYPQSLTYAHIYSKIGRNFEGKNLYFRRNQRNAKICERNIFSQFLFHKLPPV